MSDGRSADGDSTASSISVVMCTYNGGAYVAEQLRSVYNQSVQPAEIILADDGSTDETLTVVRKTAIECDPQGRVSLRILPAASNRLGPAANFMRAMDAATSPLIAPCDQDDVWHPDRLARGVERLEAQPDAQLAVADANVVDADLNPVGRSIFQSLEFDPQAPNARNLLGRLVRADFSPGMTFLLRRDLLESAQPLPAGWCHDSWLSLVAAAQGTLTVISDPLVDYRLHGSNVAAGVATNSNPWFSPRVAWSEPAHELRRLASRAPADQRALLLGKLRFESARVTIRGARLALAILWGFLNGDYHRYRIHPIRHFRHDVVQFARHGKL